MYITERLTVNNVTGNSVAGGTTTVFETDLGAVNDFYNGMEIEFTSGPCKGQQATILDYAQANGEITLVTADALSRVPTADTFIIWTELNIALGAAVNFDLVINSRFCKIAYIGIVQLTAGDMEIDFQVWESTAARGDPGNRANAYQKIIARHITQTQPQGGEYAESLSGDPMPYYDRDDQDEEKTYRLHIRIDNFAGGTASDFAVTVKIADPGESV